MRNFKIIILINLIFSSFYISSIDNETFLSSFKNLDLPENPGYIYLNSSNSKLTISDEDGLTVFNGLFLGDKLPFLRVVREDFLTSSYFFYFDDSENELFNVIGLIREKIVLPGDNSIYFLYEDESLTKRVRKFVYRNNKMIEVKQDFIHVGKDYKSRNDLIMYETTSQINQVEVIQKNRSLHIIGYKRKKVDDNFKTFVLCKSSTGLVGWVLLKEDYVYRSDIEGFGVHN